MYSNVAVYKVFFFKIMLLSENKHDRFLFLGLQELVYYP